MTQGIGLNKFSIVIILVCGFLIGTGIVGIDQLSNKPITYNNPWLVLGTYVLSTVVMGFIYILDKSDKK